MPTPKPPVEDPEEIIVTDEAAVGRAYKGSFIALVVLVTGAAVAWWALKPKKALGPTHQTRLSAPQQITNSAAASIPTAPFRDVTADAGIRFVHFTGAYGEKLLPESMGGGVGFADIDGDGDQDLLLVNGSNWPWHKAGSSPAPLTLYRNDGRGSFSDITSGSGTEGQFYGMGLAVGDYDNDGLEDLLVTGVGGARLFHNEGGGRFRDVTTAAGVGGDVADWSTAAAFFDIDNDGDLDLFVGNYVRWSREIDAEVGYKIDGSTRAYGPPMNFQGTFPRLYRNDGAGKFSDISATAGVQVKNPATGVPAAKTLGVAPAEINGDGFMDLIVANDTVQNFVFINQRNGTFKEAGAVSGMAFDSYGNTRGAMGIDAQRFTKDGRLGVAIGNFANEMIALYVAGPNPTLFTDEAISWGVGPSSRLPLKFGVFFFDWDLDGRLDLLSANGHLEEEITKVQASQKYRQSAQLFWNGGDAGFVPVTNNHAGDALFTPIVGRGAAYADIDGDGDEDVIITQAGGSPLLLRNDVAPDRNWIRLKLVGTAANRSAIGATIRVTAGGQTQWRQVMSTRSYLSACELPVTFGLGSARQADSIEITWPGGAVQMVTAAPPRQTTIVTQGQ
jgi:enediyne biosynthesis protein E4